MDIRQLRYFCTVAEELNLTRAAERMHMAQPPLSRQIKLLETEVGAPLFTREARGLALTPIGQFFLEHALQILEKVDTTVAATRRMARRGHQVFGIGMVGSLLYGQLPQLIRRLRQTDDLELLLLELTTVNQVQALKAGRIDIGFGRIRLDDPDIAQEVLFDEPIVAALPAHHPLVGTIPTLAQLAEYPNDHLSGIASSKLCRCRVQPVQTQRFESQGHSGNQRTIDRNRSGRLGSWFQSGAGAGHAHAA